MEADINLISNTLEKAIDDKDFLVKEARELQGVIKNLVDSNQWKKVVSFSESLGEKQSEIKNLREKIAMLSRFVKQ